MGLFAVIGPSTNDHRAFPRFFSTSFSKARDSFQNWRTVRSSAGKSTPALTSLNITLSPKQRTSSQGSHTWDYQGRGQTESRCTTPDAITSVPLVTRGNPGSVY